MALTLYAHPFSSYSQKVLIALYENETPFQWRLLGPDDPDAFAELERLWPFKRFPLLVDDGQAVIESSVIIEYLGLHHPGPAMLVPTDAAAALETRFMDRFFDLQVMNRMQTIVGDALRPTSVRDAFGVAEARKALDTAYRWLDDKLRDRAWAAGESFTLADCAAAPSLFYADWVHAIGADFPTLRAYRRRLLARPSFARAVEEARPYRSFFPLGAPDRD